MLIAHQPKHGNRWCLPFQWQPEATAPRTEAFLLDRLGDPASVAVWRAFANSLLTGTRTKAFVEISGVSDSGKSVVARLLEALVKKWIEDRKPGAGAGPDETVEAARRLLDGLGRRNQP